MNEELSKKDLLEVKASGIKTYLEMLENGHIATVIDDLETDLEITEKRIADIEVKKQTDKKAQEWSQIVKDRCSDLVSEK